MEGNIATKLLGQLGVDVTPAVTSTQALDGQLKKLDVTMKELTATGRLTGVTLKEAFSVLPSLEVNNGGNVNYPCPFRGMVSYPTNCLFEAGLTSGQ